MTRPNTPPAGMTTLEYLILLVLIAAVCVGIWKTFGEDGEAGQRGSLELVQAGTGAPERMLRNMA